MADIGGSNFNLIAHRTHSINPLALYPLLTQEPVREEFEKLATFTPKNGKAFLSLDHIRYYVVKALSYYLDYQNTLAVSQMACEDVIELYKNNRKKMKEFFKADDRSVLRVRSLRVACGAQAG